MSALAEVVTLYEKNAGDIAAMLRQSAESIETEEAEGFAATRAMVAVQISEAGHIQVYGWGQTNTFDSIAVLGLGAALLKRNVLEADDD